MMNALRRFREERQLSQADMAKLIGTTVASISRWETGERRPSSTMFPRIIRATKGKVTPNDFYLARSPVREAAE
jgi:transcriptional regulator with XRE-family HTH domain